MSRTTRSAALALALTGALTLTACGGGGGFEEEPSSSAPASASGPVQLQMLIASSGDAETAAVKAAADAWAEELGQHRDGHRRQRHAASSSRQGFASGKPAGRLLHGRRPLRRLRQERQPLPLRRQLERQRRLLRVAAQDLHLRGQAVLRPQGLLDPGPADQHRLVGQGRPDRRRRPDDVGGARGRREEADDRATRRASASASASTALGAFMVQNGGWWLNEDGTAGHRPTPPRSPQALEYVQKNVKAGNFQMSNQLDSGWGGEAFGTGKCRDDHRGQLDQGCRQERLPRPEVQDRRAARGPEGQGHPAVHPVLGHRRRLQGAGPGGRPRQGDDARSTSSWRSPRPSASCRAASPRADQYKAQFPEDAPFIAGGEYGQGPINAPGMEQVLADLDSKLRELRRRRTSPDVLKTFDTNAGAALAQVSDRPTSTVGRPAPADGAPGGRARRGRGPAPVASPGGCSSPRRSSSSACSWSSRSSWPCGSVLHRLERAGAARSRRRSASSAATTTRRCSPSTGLSRQDFMISLRNNFYYVLVVVPLQTVLALVLALIVNQRLLKGRTFFRTAFYFPSVDELGRDLASSSSSSSPAPVPSTASSRSSASTARPGSPTPAA